MYPLGTSSRNFVSPSRRPRRPRLTWRILALGCALLSRLRHLLGLSRFLGVGLLDLLAPPTCLACSASLERALVNAVLCERCEAEVEEPDGACICCASPLVSASPTPGSRARPGTPIRLCGVCLRKPPPQRRLVVVAVYEGPVRALAIANKRRGEVGARRDLARRLHAALGQFETLPLPVVCGVPRHPLKRWWTGVDPAVELARALAQQAALPAAPLLRRVRWRPPQRRLTRAARRRSPRASFRVVVGDRAPERVLLVDDVLTTGTTVAECAAALLAAGVHVVDVVVVARTPARQG